MIAAGSRLLVEKSVHDRVLEGVLAGSKQIKVGEPMDASTQMGPLITAEHRANVERYIKSGDAEPFEIPAMCIPLMTRSD